MKNPEKTDAEKSRELRMKYALAGREAGFLSKREADDFGNTRKVQSWESDYIADLNSRSGQARVAAREKAQHQIQSKLDRMVAERGTIEKADYEEFNQEIDSGKIQDQRGRARGTSTFLITKNPLAK